MVVKGVVFLVFWIVLVFLLRLFVDGWVYVIFSDVKLSVVWVIVYWEVYLNDLVEIDRFDEFNVIVSDEVCCDLVIVLLFLLVFLLIGFNVLIECNVEVMVDILLSNR